MLTKLVDLFLQFLDAFRFLQIIKAWEVGVVLRFGRYHRTIEPGLHWVIPLWIESTTVEWSVPVVKPLVPQSLTTADGVPVVLSAVLTYRVQNARKLVCEVGGHESALQDAATGVIASYVTSEAWDGLQSEDFLKRLTAAVHRQARPWGLAVQRVAFADIAKCRTIRVVTGKCAPEPLPQ